MALAAQLIKNACPLDVEAAKEWSRGSAWTYKDTLISAAYGKLLTIYGTNGQPWHGRRVLSSSIQALLDSIGLDNGSILYRSVDGWAALAPGDPGQYPTPNTARTAIEWMTPTGSSGGAGRVAALGFPEAAMSWAHHTTIGANYMRLKPVLLTSAVDVNGVQLPCRTLNATIHGTPVLYSDNAGAPDALLASGDTMTGFEAGIVSMPFTSAYTPPGNAMAWLGWIHTASSLDTVDCALATYYAYLSTSSDTPPDPASSASIGNIQGGFWGY